MPSKSEFKKKRKREKGIALRGVTFVCGLHGTFQGSLKEQCVLPKTFFDATDRPTGRMNKLSLTQEKLNSHVYT